jgi:cytochrome c peroxidase
MWIGGKSFNPGRSTFPKWAIAALLGAAPIFVMVVISAGLSAQGRNFTFAPIPNLKPFHDPSGEVSTFSTAGFIDATNPFFQDLGTNGRRCVTCHQPSDAWSVTPPHLQRRFDATDGTDPIFRPVDGATCPNDDVATIGERREAYKLVLSKGLIRIGLSVPAGADFSVQSVDTPYQDPSKPNICGDTANLSMYRRPLPATNLVFLSTVMFDGREFPLPTTQKPFTEQEILASLKQQAIDATEGHAQGSRPTDEQLAQIVAFETGIFTAQARDNRAGRLHSDGGLGGPVELAGQNFFLGINDPLGHNPNNIPFSSVIFTLFQNWEYSDADGEDATEARRSIARGENLFNTLPITITGVGGLNDIPLQDGQIHPSIVGSCGTCHDSPNVGDHSFPAPLNIGVADASRRTPDLPLFTIKCSGGSAVYTTDPGRAMVTGKCADIGKFKGPILRGLAARAPYFHNGLAATLEDVITFYQTRFSLGLTDREQRDLAAFLKSL